MLNQSAIIAGSTPSNPAMVEKIQSRFGEILVDTEKSILFPRGLLGMPDKFNFALTSFPSEKMRQFTLLQSLDDTSLSFITLPLNAENGIVGASDVQTACRDLQISDKNMALLLLVSVHRNLNGTRLSVNARAPLFIDAERKTGVQYVFQQDTYKVQHMLGA